MLLPSQLEGFLFKHFIISSYYYLSHPSPGWKCAKENAKKKQKTFCHRDECLGLQIHRHHRITTKRHVKNLKHTKQKLEKLQVKLMTHTHNTVAGFQVQAYRSLFFWKWKINLQPHNVKWFCKKKNWMRQHGRRKKAFLSFLMIFWFILCYMRSCVFYSVCTHQFYDMNQTLYLLFRSVHN